MNLGKILQDLRKKKNISQEEIADKLNVSRQTISNWENCKSYPDIISLIRLCNIYKISFDDLLKNNEDIMKNIKKKEKKNKYTIISCISIIAILIFTLVYIMFLKDYLHNIKNIKNEIQLINNNGDYLVEIKKSKIYNEDEMTINYMKITDSEYKDITLFLDNNNYKYSPVYKLMNYHNESTDIMTYEAFNLTLKINNINYDLSPFNWFYGGLDIVIYNNDFNEKIIGKFPSSDNQIMISNVLANYIINNGIKTDNNDFYPTNYNDIINYKGYYYFGNYKIKISGIIDYDLSKYNDLKNISWDDLNTNYIKYNNIFNSFCSKIDSTYNKIYVNKSFIHNFNKSNFETSDHTWQKHLIRTGILITENDKNKLLKLFKKMDNNPYSIKSSYSALFDKDF